MWSPSALAVTLMGAPGGPTLRAMLLLWAEPFAARTLKVLNAPGLVMVCVAVAVVPVLGLVPLVTT